MMLRYAADWAVIFRHDVLQCHSKTTVRKTRSLLTLRVVTEWAAATGGES
jgi:hypothetical protein